jgi:hypothetical protein
MAQHDTAIFTDSDGWSWEFDLAFMLSHYGCIWGCGCPDITGQGTARGCCVLGVEIYRGKGDKAGRADLANIRRHVKQLTDEDWQNRGVALARGGRDPWGKARFKPDSVHTRTYHGACIFHNRPDHPAGAGCALHLAALRRGEDPIDWKPEICWQVPLFFESDTTTRTTLVRASRTPDWGPKGIVDWWCTEREEAYGAKRPVYLSMEKELRRVCGDAVYEEMAACCRARQRHRRPRRPRRPPPLPITLLRPPRP